MPSGFSIEAGTPGERGEQVALFNACFTKDVTEADLSWRYEQSLSKCIIFDLFVRIGKK